MENIIGGSARIRTAARNWFVKLSQPNALQNAG
jgi:hypothetical protein